MPDPDISFQLLQIGFPEDFLHKPHTFVKIDLPLRTVGIRYGNPAGFLSPMLKCR